jgi:phosphoheptose isomerase/choline kinase
MNQILSGTLGLRDPRAARPRLLPAQIDCVVLCGGLGTRLADAVPGLPKCLAEVAGRPFIEWVLLGLRTQGVTDVLLATGHRGDQLEARLSDGGHLGLRLRYSREPSPRGTAGALRFALPSLHRDAVLLINGDTYCEIDIATVIDTHSRRPARVTMLATHVPDRGRYGSLEVGLDEGVLSFGEKRAGGPGLVSCGVYLVDRDVVEGFPSDTRLDMETDVLPQLGAESLFAVVNSGPFIDIGTPESLARATDVIERHVRPALRQTRGNALAHVRAHLDATAVAMRRVADDCSPSVVDAAELVAEAFTSGNKLMLCGNGGSAADCQHVAAEFVSRLDRAFDRAALPAIALTTDSSFLTAYANDVDFEGVFARQVEALGQPGDVLLAISTSGASRNVGRAVEAAHRRHMRVVGLFGDSAPLADIVDVAVIVPSRSTAATQECMLAIEHSICELVEQIMYGRGAAAGVVAEQAAS